MTVSSNPDHSSKSAGFHEVKDTMTRTQRGQELLNRRTSGILLHPTSLPGPHGIGDFGPWARQFIEFLTRSGCSLWQLLPLGPTGLGGSPYQCTSSFAGNPLLINIEELTDMGLVDPDESSRHAVSESSGVDFAYASETKHRLLAQAYRRFREEQNPVQIQAFKSFVEMHGWWLDDYVLYEAVKIEQNGLPWYTWPPELLHREQSSLNDISSRLHDRLEYLRFIQFLFFTQWNSLKETANRNGIYIVGDIPIFPSHDSADVWAHTDIFKLDEHGQPYVMAGVPPDYFSEDGQLWGNPLYRWDILSDTGYEWWIQRFKHTLEMVDIIRIDHFRGFAAAWEVPSGESTARNGKWVEGPGITLFKEVRARLGALPLIAEDLGHITPDVDDLRKSLQLPGMKILQFAFDSDADNPYLPHNHTPDSVVYTGTHDNDTTRGFFESAESFIRDKARAYMGRSQLDLPWDIIRLAFASVANTAIIPLQDVFCLGTEARMNFPGKPEGNWLWRFTPRGFDGEKAAALHGFAELYGRILK